MKTQKKTLFILIIVIIAMAFISAGCENSYAPVGEEKESLATPTMGGEGFPDAMPENMDGVFESGAQTATALAIASGMPPVEVIPTNTADPNAPAVAPAVFTNTPIPPAGVIPTNTVAPAPISSVGKPTTYTLQKGEFPYCIARRFDVHPSELLNLNGLSDAQARSLQPGLTLTIPQGGKVFPSARALNTHPGSYTLPQNMTVYAVACYFGDLDPAAITSANTIADINNIAAGTILTIP